MLGVLPYTPEEVAVPADAAGDASSVLVVCSSATAPFCSSDVAFGAHGIEIGRPPRPDRVLAGAVARVSFLPALLTRLRHIISISHADWAGADDTCKNE